MISLTLSLSNIGTTFPNTPGVIRYLNHDGEMSVVLAGNIRVSAFDILMEDPNLTGQNIGLIPTKSLEKAEKLYFALMMNTIPV